MTETPLIESLKDGMPTIAKLLIAQGDDIHVPDRYGQTALFFSLSYPDVADLLLKRGANPNARDKTGPTPLHEAAYWDLVPACQLLIEAGAALDAQGPSGRTPLHEAALYGHFGIAKLLIDHGAKVNLADDDGNTPFHSLFLANIERHKLGLFLQTGELLIRGGADLRARNKKNETPLDLATAYAGYPELARFLKKKRR